METRKEHKGDAEDCPVCKQSKLPRCAKCGHALTGTYDEYGRTKCVVCGEPEWVGVGDYND